MKLLNPFRDLAFRSLHSSVTTTILLAMFTLTLPALAFAIPYKPTDAAQVLERLPFKPGEASVRELREQRDSLARDPENVELAAQAARDFIARGRAQGDPRYFGYAQAALRPWWDDQNPPADILFLRATLRQSSHDFKGALSDLDKLLANEPGNLNAALSRAVIFQVKGDYAQAKESCAPLLRHPRLQLMAQSCISSIESFNGKGQASYDALRQVLENHPDASPEDRQWALTIMADTAARIGQSALAEQHFKEAMSLGRDNWLIGTYADFLLDQGRPQEVIDLLKNETDVDNLLLLLALAEQDLKAPLLSKHVAMLRARFDAGRMRNDQRHQREEARFALHLLHEPEQALKLAQDNWAVQHEPEDARILIAAALAAENLTAAQPVVEFLERTGMEDAHLEKLVAQVKDLSA